MRTTRIYSPLALATGATVAMTPEAANHLARVLRAQVGDELAIFDGRGSEFSASIAAIAAKSVTVRVGARIGNHAESPLNEWISSFRRLQNSESLQSFL
jgi:16S rRNA (uracil1498-N3)-methyltransferase